MARVRRHPGDAPRREREVVWTHCAFRSGIGGAVPAGRSDGDPGVRDSGSAGACARIRAEAHESTRRRVGHLSISDLVLNEQNGTRRARRGRPEHESTGHRPRYRGVADLENPRCRQITLCVHSGQDERRMVGRPALVRAVAWIHTGTHERPGSGCEQLQTPHDDAHAEHPLHIEPHGDGELLRAIARDSRPSCDLESDRPGRGWSQPVHRRPNPLLRVADSTT